MTSDLCELTGRVAIVTGGGANVGIGHAIALELAQAGADLLVSDLDAEGAAQTAREVAALGRRSAACHCDNGSPEQIAAMFAEFDRAFARIDVLVNNTGHILPVDGGNLALNAGGSITWPEAE
jgi:NAD(P)-dependent dehydrogenase (short-subunit alcohol dehydrogenase family)